jgi:hypothetical protein
VGGRYYTDDEFNSAVQRQVRWQLQQNQYYGGQVRNAVRQQNRGWLYQLVRTAVNVVFGSVVGDLVGRGVDAVWDFFSNLFSG